MRVQRKPSPRFAAGQPMKRSHTSLIRAASSARGALGNGEASVMSNAPPRISRRMFTVRIFPPESTGNRYRGDTKRSLGRGLMRLSGVARAAEPAHPVQGDEVYQ